MDVPLTVTSVNCRLPMTPRTPSVAANHYFDDIFTRYRPSQRHHLRRSSTSRSIGQRSDWNSGAGTDIDDEDEQEFYYARRQNSVGHLDANHLQKQKEVDQQVAAYVNEQLEQLRSPDSQTNMKDELEAVLDGP